MKKWLVILLCLSFLLFVGCSSYASNQTNFNPTAEISYSGNNELDNVNKNNTKNVDIPDWAQPIEKHGQLFKGLNLDGIGNNDDEAYISLYVWDNNGFDRYDASQLVLRIRLGTGDTTAHIINAVGSFQFYTGRLFSEKKDAIVLEVNNQYANSGLVSVFAFDVYGAGETDVFPSIVERLNTTGEAPVLSGNGEKLYIGSLLLGTAVTDIDDKPLQGIELHSSGDGYQGPIDDRETQIICWNGDGWIVHSRAQSKHD